MKNIIVILLVIFVLVGQYILSANSDVKKIYEFEEDISYKDIIMKINDINTKKNRTKD